MQCHQGGKKAAGDNSKRQFDGQCLVRFPVDAEALHGHGEERHDGGGDQAPFGHRQQVERDIEYKGHGNPFRESPRALVDVDA